MMKKIKQKSGVVAYRMNDNDNLEILLISARKFKGSWVFPVGTVEKNESLEEAAVRECLEESGYEVALEEKIDSIVIEKKESKNEFTFYKAKIIGEQSTYETDRKRLWVTLSELEEKITHVFLPIAHSFKNLQTNLFNS